MTFVGPFFTEFHRGGFLGISLWSYFWNLRFRSLSGKLLWSCYFGNRFWYRRYDSEAIRPDWRDVRVSRMRSDAVFHGEAAGLSLQVPHLPKAPLPPVARVRCGPLFHWGTERCRGTTGPPYSRAHERCRRTAWRVLPRKSSASTTRFAWPGLAPTSGISLKLTVATTRTPSTAQAPLLVTLSWFSSTNWPIASPRRETDKQRRGIGKPHEK